MDYINSNMPKVTEGYRLLKRSLFDSKGQANRMFVTYERIRREFDLDGKSILELGAGGRKGLICLFAQDEDVIGIDKHLGW